MNSSGSLTVAIVTRNRPQLLRECLASVYDQSRLPEAVIVVDNSIGSYGALLTSAKVPLTFIHTTLPLGSQPAMRNIALHRCHTQFIAFLDDDCTVNDKWAESLVKSFDGSETWGGIGGRIVDEDQSLPTPIAEVGRYSVFGGTRGGFDCDAGESILSVHHIQGTNMAFRVDALAAIGGFDEALGGYATFEELDVCLGLRRAGYEIGYCSNAIAYHRRADREGGFTREGSWRQTYHVARNEAYVVRKHFGLTLRTVLALVLVNPLLDLVRYMFGSARHPKISVRGLINVYLAAPRWAGALSTVLRLRKART